MKDRVTSSFEGTINVLLDEQLPQVQEAMVNIAILTWFDLEALQNMMGDDISKDQTQAILDVILDWDLTQPFGNVGYTYHEDTRQVLIARLEQEPDLAITIYQRAIIYLKNQMNHTTKFAKNALQREIGNQLLGLGGVYFDHGNNKKAIEYWQEALNYFENMEESSLSGTVYHRLGQAYLADKNFTQALIYYNYAIDIFRNLNDKPVARKLITDLGSILDGNGEWGKADEVYEMLLKPELYYDFTQTSSDEADDSSASYIETVADHYANEKGAGLEGQQKWTEAQEAYSQAKSYYDQAGNLVRVREMEGKIKDMTIKATKENLTDTIIPHIKQILTERLPQLASATATGVVSLSLGLALANVVQSAPEDVFIYVAGLAPNIISDMLMKMHRREQPVDAETIAQAVAERLNEPEMRHLADELQILDSLAEVMQDLQAQSEQLRQVSQTLIQEMQDLRASNWTIPQSIETNLNMIAQGSYISQAAYGGIAITNVGDNAKTVIGKSFIRIQISNPDNLAEQQRAITQSIQKMSLKKFEIQLNPTDADTWRQANLNMQACDIYIRLSDQPQIEQGSIVEYETKRAGELAKPYLLYCLGEEPSGLHETGSECNCLFGVFDGPDAWAKRVKSDLETIFSSSDFKTRRIPFSGRRGLIASIGRSPGAVTGLYYALTKSRNPSVDYALTESRNLSVDYVWTISTADPEVSRAVDTVRKELASKVAYQDFPISVQDLRNDRDIIEFKRIFVNLLTKARAQGDALAIGVTGGRTVMGALIAQVSQVEAPANSAFYQLSVPNAIEEDGRYPRFGNQTIDYQQTLLNPMEKMDKVCHLLEIPFNHFYQDVYEEM